MTTLYASEVGLQSNSPTHSSKNTEILNNLLSPQNFTSGSTLIFPLGETYYLDGGIQSNGLYNVTIVIDGMLKYTSDPSNWPRKDNDHVLECMSFHNPTKLTIKSTLGGGQRGRMGVIDGSGHDWWWWPLIGYLEYEENRPRLLTIDKGEDVLLKDILFLDPPYWTTSLHCMDGLEISGCAVSARRTSSQGHSLLDVSAFNTDGFDISGRNVHVHDCNCYAQDDCFTVKDCGSGSQDMVFENNNASGMAMVIGSIGGTHVHNITFRNFVVHKTFKGIYTKFRGGEGKMTDILFDNVVMYSPEQFPIWLGPAQQSDNPDPCYANPCSLCWPDDPGAECYPIQEARMENITLRNIKIHSPGMSLGVIMGSDEFPMKNLTFHNVVVDQCGAQSTPSFEETFPLLPTEVWDPWVARSVAILASGGFAFLFLFCCLPIFCCYYHDLCKCWKKNTKIKASLLAALAIGLASPFLWYRITLVDKYDKTGFLRCSGVLDATATGNTHPVPECFNDETDGSHDGSDQICVVMGWWWVFSIFFLSVVAGITFIFRSSLPRIQTKSSDSHSLMSSI